MVHITNVSVKAHFSHPQQLVVALPPAPVRTQTLLKRQWMQVSASTTASFPRPDNPNFHPRMSVFFCFGSTTIVNVGDTSKVTVGIEIDLFSVRGLGVL